MFKKLAEAFTVLSDADLRSAYDEDSRSGRTRKMSCSLEERIARTMRETQRHMAKGEEQGIDWCFVGIAVAGAVIAVWVAIR
mmetsp:Transcript_55466/g.147988  ORF Transcript_55466/g.147988 Transcript_55466/m.147988 type:complete len:82 (+) Transcript_55466:1-246(+)